MLNFHRYRLRHGSSINVSFTLMSCCLVSVTGGAHAGGADAK